MLKIQTGFDKKLNQPIYEELTIDFFKEHLDYEYWFKYHDKSIDIAHYFDKIKNKKIYHISINNLNDTNYKNAIHQEFESAEELLNKGRIEGKTLPEIWNDLEN